MHTISIVVFYNNILLALCEPQDRQTCFSDMRVINYIKSIYIFKHNIVKVEAILKMTLKPKLLYICTGERQRESILF